MWTSCFLFAVTLTAALASEFGVFDQNGWQPVSSDMVANQFRRGLTQSPRFTKVDDVVVTISHHKEIDNEPLGEITHKEIEKCDEKGYQTCVQKIPKTDPELQFENDFIPNQLQFVKETRVSGPVRKSKMISETDFIVNDLLLTKNGNFEFGDKKQVRKLDKKSDDNIHTYEVTENTIVEDATKQETELKVNGYEYSSPDEPNVTGIFKYLSKYNINEGDKLQNYALSRRPKAETPKTDIRIHKPLHYKVPIRYNSLNHLSADPLLAVFLSNYGYYLQGQYGIHNNYNNLYGYLASNNIHNNKPFGFYKLFSDTDSSN